MRNPLPLPWMDQARKILSKPWFTPLFLALPLFLFGLGALPFLGADEPRYARISEEMLASGDWIVPHLEGKRWLEKPPLYYWLAGGVYAVFGPGETQARLPSAWAMIGTVLLVAFFGARWFSPKVGRIAGILTAASVAATAFSRAASMDALFTFLLLAGLFLFADSLWPLRRAKAGRFLLSALVLGMAVLAKGLLGLLLSGAILVLFMILSGAWRRLPWAYAVAWPAVALLVALPWHGLAFQRAGYDFLATYLINHHLARYFTELHHHAQPTYYYLGVLVVGFLPWSPWLFLLFRRGSVGRHEKKRTSDLASRELLMLLHLTAGFILFFFSISASKLPGYILPAFPILALLLAVVLERRQEENRGREETLATWLAPLALALVGLGGTGFLMQRYQLPVWKAALIGAAFLSAPPWVWWRVRRGSLRWDAAIQGCATAWILGVLALTTLAAGQLGAVHSTREISRRALASMSGNGVLASYRFFHHTLGYYSGYRWLGNWEDQEVLNRELSTRAASEVYLVTEPRYEAEIQRIATAGSRKAETLDRVGPRILVRLTPSAGVK